MKEEPNIHTTVDSRGCKPDTDLLNSTWRHTGNQNIYRLTGYTWFGDEDIWLIEFNRVEGGTGTKYTRSIINFTEDRQGKPRFEQVWGLNRGHTITYVNQAEIDQLKEIERKIIPNRPYSMGAYARSTEEVERQTTKLRNMDSYD